MGKSKYELDLEIIFTAIAAIIALAYGLINHPNETIKFLLVIAAILLACFGVAVVVGKV